MRRPKYMHNTRTLGKWIDRNPGHPDAEFARFIRCRRQVAIVRAAPGVRATDLTSAILIGADAILNFWNDEHRKPST